MSENLTISDHQLVEVVQLVMETGRPSVSFLQRKLKFDYNTCCQVVERMTELGIVSAPQSSKGRDILWTDKEFQVWAMDIIRKSHSYHRPRQRRWTVLYKLWPYLKNSHFPNNSPPKKVEFLRQTSTLIWDVKLLLLYHLKKLNIRNNRLYRTFDFNPNMVCTLSFGPRWSC